MSSYPAEIKVIGYDKTGDVDVIHEYTVPFPKPKSNEILVKVQWAGVNFIDTYFRSGLYPAPSLPNPSAKEVSGVIVELPSDESIVNSADFKKRGFKVGGKVVLDVAKGLQEYTTVAWDGSVYPVPDSIPTRTAAAALIQLLTALGQTTDAYNVKKGDVVFIHTIAGGTGLLHAQIAKSRGATVIGTTSTPEKAEYAKKFGADHVILYKSEDVVKRVLELTNGLGAHVVYDGVGKDTFDQDFKIVRRKGTIVSFGNASGPVPPVPLFKLTEKNVKLLRPTAYNWIVTQEEKDWYGKEIFDLIESGKITINIHQEYPFTAEGVQQAHRDLVGGKTTGKLIIKVADN